MIDSELLAAASHFLPTTPPQQLRRARRSDGSSCGAILILGIDGLAEIARRHGSATADLALQVVETALRRSLGEDDGLVRWSNADFLLLLSEGEADRVADFGELQVMGTRVLTVPLPGGADLPLTCSIGWSNFDWSDRRSHPWRRPIAVAKTALANARALGGDCVFGPPRLERADAHSTACC